MPRPSGSPIPPSGETPAGFRLAPPAIASARAAALRKIDANLVRFGAAYPWPCSTQGRYPLIENEQWTAGFWPGLLWLAWEASGDECYLAAARAHVPSFARRIRERIDVNHHDLGFLYSLSCVPAWKQCGDRQARAAALEAAECLAGRFKPRGGFIQAWGDLDDPKAHRMIIDCLMNLPLLFWAARESGEPRFRQIAETHLRTTLEHVVRPDGSTYHTFYFDPETGAPAGGVTAQGLRDDSSWARGQAWAICGLPLVRRHIDDPAIMTVHRGVTEHFLERLPGDRVCYWDLTFTEGDEERDSSAAAIAVCGLLAALPYVDDPSLQRRYETAAHEILGSLMANYAAGDDVDGLLLHAVYSKPHKQGVDECCLWGDYFYLEALVRLSRAWESYW